MGDHHLQQPQPAADEPDDVFAPAGVRLRRARERLGLSRADIAARTKIAERHLAAIDEERFSDLASSTYAVGFSRAYARAVGLDEREIAQAVRSELDLVEEEGARPAATFEPGDPARVPTPRTAWIAGIVALAVIGAVFWFWGSMYAPAVSLPDLTSDKKPPAAAAIPAPAPTPAASGIVVLTAKEAGVWVKITDGAGNQIFQKEMAQGESFTIPPGTAEPQLRTAWPDALAITVDGRTVAPLSDRRQTITAPVSAAALLSRGAAAPPPAAPAASSAGAAPAGQPAVPAASPVPRPSASARPLPLPRASGAPAASPSAAAPSSVVTPPAALPATAAAAPEAPKASPVSD